MIATSQVQSTQTPGMSASDPSGGPFSMYKRRCPISFGKPASLKLTAPFVVGLRDCQNVLMSNIRNKGVVQSEIVNQWKGNKLVYPHEVLFCHKWNTEPKVQVLPFLRSRGLKPPIHDCQLSCPKD